MSNRMPLSKQRSRGYNEEVTKYLTLIGAAPVLPPEEQDQLFLQLRTARIALETLVLNSSAPHMLSGDHALTPGFLTKDWTLAITERTCSRLLAYAGQVSDRAATRLALKAEALRKVIHASREKAIESNLRLVCTIAVPYRNRGLELNDVIQAGNIGLIKGVWYYDLTRGARFSTYAQWWIRQSILRAIVATGRTIALSSYTRKKMGQVVRAERKLTRGLGRTPTTEEIAEAIGGKDLKKVAQEIDELRAYFQDTTSLDAPLGHKADDELLLDMLPDRSSPAPDRFIDHEQLRQLMRKLLAYLDPQQEKVLRMRFGFDGGQQHTLKEIGEKIGLSRERVRQIEMAAKKRLQYRAYKIGLEIFRQYLDDGRR